MPNDRPSAWATTSPHGSGGRRLTPRSAEEVRRALEGYTHAPSPQSLARAEAFERCMRADGLHRRVD